MYFDDDDDDNEMDGLRSLDELMVEFNKAKKGVTPFKLLEDDFALLIDFFETEGDSENARIACEIGVQHYPFAVELLLRKAETLIERQNLGQAIKVLDKIDNIAPDYVEAIFLRIDIYNAQENFIDAIQLIKAKVDKFTGMDRDDLLFELSDIYDEMEDFDKVYETLKEVVKGNSKNEEALHRICFWADLTEQHEDAIVLYQEILDTDPFNALAWYNIGVAYQGIKMHEKAIESYTYCIDIDETFEYAYRNMGDAYMQLKLYDLAIETLEKHINLGVAEDLILEAIAYCWEKKKNYTEARNFYRRAANLNQQDASIFYKIGETYTKEKKWEKAKNAYLRACTLEQDNATYCIALGNCFLELDVPLESIRYFVLAINFKPQSKIVWQSLVRGLYKLGYYHEALEQLDVAQEAVGDKAEWHYYRAANHLANGRTKEALIHLESGLADNVKKINALAFLDKDLMHHPLFTDLIALYKVKKG
jgi:tetratricopeptide (TPR) repeat protein